MVSDPSAEALDLVKRAVLQRERNLGDYSDVSFMAASLHMGRVFVHNDILELIHSSKGDALKSLLVDIKMSGGTGVSSVDHWYQTGNQVASLTLICARSSHYEGLFIDRPSE